MMASPGVILFARSHHFDVVYASPSSSTPANTDAQHYFINFLMLYVSYIIILSFFSPEAVFALAAPSSLPRNEMK